MPGGPDTFDDQGGAAVLGVSTLSYLPYALFNMASPMLSVAYGITGFRIETADGAATSVGAPEPVAADRERSQGGP